MRSRSTFLPGLPSLAPLAMIALLGAFAALAPGVARALEEDSSIALSKAGYEAATRGDWPGAIRSYSALVDRGVADPRLFYNLGTAYARAGDKGRAVWMLLRARALAPSDREVRANLEEIAPDVLSQVAFFPLPPLEAVYRLATLNGWAGFAALATCLAAGVAAWGRFRPRDSLQRRAAGRAARVVAVVALVAHAFGACRYYEDVVLVRGVVVGREVHPSAAPGDDAPVYDFPLPPGTVVRASYAGTEGWVRAVYGADNEVFVRRDQIEYLRPF